MDALLTPAFGAVFWASSFLTVLFILRKVAWGPILGLNDREESITNSLYEAEKAREG